MKVLFSAWPVGASHIGRCIVIANILKENGFNVAFESDPSGRNLIQREGLNVIRECNVRDNIVRKPDTDFLAIPGFDWSIASIGFYNKKRVTNSLDLVLSSIDRFKPNLIVTHMDPIIVLAAKIRGLPVVSIAAKIVLDSGYNPWMPWLKNYSPPMMYPSALDAINSVLEDYGLNEVESFQAFFSGDISLVPNVREIEPVKKAVQDVPLHYVGPLIWNPSNRAKIDFNKFNGQKNKTKVYLTVGSGQIARSDFFTVFLEKARERDWQVIVQGGYDTIDEKNSENIIQVGFGGIAESLDWCDICVNHGGHSTVLATLLHGKPQLVFPGMSECELNGRFMVEDNNAGILLNKTMEENGELMFHSFDNVPSLIGNLTSSQIEIAMDSVTSNIQYRESADQLSGVLKRALSSQDEKLVEVFSAL